MVTQKYSKVMSLEIIFVEGIFIWGKVPSVNFGLVLSDLVPHKGEKKAALSNKKGGEVSTFFAPNLTMNLTYLCYGKPKSTLRKSLKC